MKHSLRATALALATLVVLGSASTELIVSPAAAAVTKAEQLSAARRGAEWIELLQEPSGELGGFGGDWSMISLASLGINAADVHLSPSEPSAQDFYLSLWTGEHSVLSSATDYERAILASNAAGLEPSRLSAQTNLVADLAAQFDGHELGGKGVTNADVFGALAFAAVGVPTDVLETLAQRVREQQDADGGWNFAAGAKTSEADLTGAALDALCTAGVPVTDAAIVDAESYLHTVQDVPTGGFFNSSHLLNTDSTAWVLSGLYACKLDPQGPRWTTTADKTPVDFLISEQNEDGSFEFKPGTEEEDFYSTQDAIRALAGGGFIVPAPLRKESGQPAVRPAPTIAAGTPVPMTLVIDSAGHVTGGSSIRMCKVLAPVGASVERLLLDATEAATPAYCLSDLSFQGGRISRLNGVDAEPGKTAWEIYREGGAGEFQANGPVGLGALVQIQLVSSDQSGDELPGALPSQLTPLTTPVALSPGSHRSTSASSLRVHVGPLTRVRGGRIVVKIACPRDVSSGGCSGAVRVSMALHARRHKHDRPIIVGEREVRLAAGFSGKVVIALDSAALMALHTRDDRMAWILATTHRAHASANTTTSTVLR